MVNIIPSVYPPNIYHIPFDLFRMILLFDGYPIFIGMVLISFSLLKNHI